MKNTIKLTAILMIFINHLAPRQVLAQSSNTKKNVILITVDDMNDWANPFGGYNRNLEITPNIKKLADKGTTFLNAHCNYPLCGPSRASFLTGRLPTALSVLSNNDELREHAPNIITMPQHFKNNGYETVASGKIFHNGAGSGTTPKPASDPVSWTRQHRNGVGTPFPPQPNRQQTGLDYSDLGSSNQAFDFFPLENINTEDTNDWKNADYCVNFLESKGRAVINGSNTDPFFLAYGVFRPHLPFFAPKEFFNKFPLNSIQLPKIKPNGVINFRDIDDIVVPSFHSDLHNEVLRAGEIKRPRDPNIIWKEFTQAYLASLNFADLCVGLVLDALENSPPEIKNNTIVVLMGDHGFSLGEKESWKKNRLWEEQTQTPLIIYDPSVNTGTRRGNVVKNSKAVSLVDVFPTLIELSGVKRKISNTAKFNKLDGISLKPLMEDPKTQWKNTVLITDSETSHALRDGRYRYIANNYNNNSRRTEELYDHRNDPNEFNNLLAGNNISEDIINRRNRYRRVLNRKIIESQQDAPTGNGSARELILTKEGEFMDNKTVLYPTPVMDYVNVKLANSLQTEGITEIYVFNVNGKLVDQIVTKENIDTVKLSTKNYKKGIYFLKVVKNKVTQKTIKFIK